MVPAALTGTSIDGNPSAAPPSAPAINPTWLVATPVTGEISTPIFSLSSRIVATPEESLGEMLNA